MFIHERSSNHALKVIVLCMHSQLFVLIATFHLVRIFFLMLSRFVEHMVLLLNGKVSEIFLLLWSWPWVLLRDQTRARNTWKNCLFSLIAYYVLHPFNMFLKTV